MTGKKGGGLQFPFTVSVTCICVCDYSFVKQETLFFQRTYDAFSECLVLKKHFMHTTVGFVQTICVSVAVTLGKEYKLIFF